MCRARAPSAREPQTNRPDPPSHRLEDTTSRAPFRLAGRLADGVDNLCVSGTTAEISGQALTDFSLGRLRMAREKIHGGQNHARRANPALRPSMREKCLLECMQTGSFGNPFNRANLRIVGLQDRYETTIHQFT